MTSVSTTQKEERSKTKLLGELGTVVCDGLEDPTVLEIMLNPDGQIWFDRMGSGMEPVGRMSAVNAIALIGTIADSLSTTITSLQPILEGELVIDGSRVEAVIPPIVPRPTFAIRKRASQVFPLAHYVETKALTEDDFATINEALVSRKNVLIAGGTGSGKTTLVNAAIDTITRQCPNDRLVLLEDTIEIQCPADNFIQMRTSSQVSMTELLRATMRLRPDRILVGEVRGAEALALLKAWNTGHPGGVATVHANGAKAALVRLASLIGEAGLGRADAMDLINAAVDVVVFIERTKKGRRISEIYTVDDSNVLKEK